MKKSQSLDILVQTQKHSTTFIRVLGYYDTFYRFIRFLPQGTVDINPGPDLLACPKALDPNQDN